jgi:hypothetical protein
MVSGRTRAEARRKLDELRRERERGLDVTSRTMAFDQLAYLRLERGLPGETSDATREDYSSVVKTHLLPQLGHRRLSELRPDHVEALLAQMAAAGYSGRTMRLVTNLCGRVLALGLTGDWSRATSPPSSRSPADHGLNATGRPCSRRARC